MGPWAGSGRWRRLALLGQRGPWAGCCCWPSWVSWPAWAEARRRAARASTARRRGSTPAGAVGGSGDPDPDPAEDGERVPFPATLRFGDERDERDSGGGAVQDGSSGRPSSSAGRGDGDLGRSGGGPAGSGSPEQRRCGERGGRRGDAVEEAGWRAAACTVVAREELRGTGGAPSGERRRSAGPDPARGGPRPGPGGPAAGLEEREVRWRLAVGVARKTRGVGCLGELYVQNREPVPPVAVIPLGTGNDLSRSFGWGASFPFSWKAAAKRSLYKAILGTVSCLDSWHIVVSMPEEGEEEQELDLPHSLRHLGECTFYDDGTAEGELAETVCCFDGVFYNYFSIGMDAQVAYGFHQLRDEKPFLASGPLSNKLIYAGYTCKQGWFFTQCISDPELRGLTNIIRLSIKKMDSSEWERIPVPSSVRAIVALNLHNYASGRNPWGNLKPEYLEKKGFVEAQSDDGLLEIFGLKQGWHASLVMVELISAKHIAQAAAIRLEIKGGQWRDAYMQMDGEPWKQPLSTEYSTFVDIKRVPYPSLIISGADR